MIEFSKPLDSLVLKQSINDRINKATFNHAAAIQVMNVLKDFDGKTISKRITTALTASMPGYSFYLDPPAFSSSHIKVYFKGDQLFSIYLKIKPDSHKEYDHQATVQDNQWIQNTIASIDSLRLGLITVDHLVIKYNSILASAKQLAKDAELYNLQYDLDIANNSTK
jgi:hypothetical protein